VPIDEVTNQTAGIDPVLVEICKPLCR
jgi:hypothetical protein